MTETSSVYTTHSLIQPSTVTTLPASASPLPNGTLSDSNVQDEEEYTIKCICIYIDDDGNTVYCPKCDTWQHIECYYHGKKVPEEHFCADCHPRDLDARKATERQRRAREQLEGGDRKVKRPAAKTSKKKQKDANSHESGGWSNHDRHDSLPNGKDQPPPAKKPKTSHRSSNSVVSMNGETRRRAHSNVQSYPSPSKSPQDVYRFPIPQYTSEFLDLYERDEVQNLAEGNEHTIPALNHLSRWKSDSSIVVDGATEQTSVRKPFVYMRDGFEHTSWPRISLEHYSNTSIDCDGRHPSWRFLKIQQPVTKDTIVGEICGQVGMLEEYCQQQSSQNRWSELAHPDPFVFFHPHMNIYIDSRKKGTQFRYLRRSCQPNVTLRTFVTDDGEARHCFVANQDIAAGSELTAAWFINPAMFDMNADREDHDHVQNRRCDWVSRVLANFGDCACDHTNCPFTGLDRRTSVKTSDAATKAVGGRKRKGKGKQAISPLSTGQATNSRAGSETIKGPEDDDQDDHHSTSGSSRGEHQSRDNTPSNVAILDADPVLGPGLSARELRKIQAAEKAFQLSSQKREQAATGTKKKKRTSGGPSLGTPNLNSSKNFGLSPLQSDIKQFSGSPPPSLTKDLATTGTKRVRPAQSGRPVYTSVGVQTEPEENMVTPSPKRIRYITPMQRLLKKIKIDRERYIQQQKSPCSDQPLQSPSADIEMKDAGIGLSPTVSTSTSDSPNVSPSLRKESNGSEFPLPSQAAHTYKTFSSTSSTPRLHLSTLPPVPAFPIAANGTVVTPNSATTTPALTTPSIAKSPPSLMTALAGSTPGTVAPSPAKKKMSLGEWSRRRNQVTTPATEKSQAQALGEDQSDGGRKPSNAGSDVPSDGSKPTMAVAEEVAQAGGVDGSAIEDTPMKDEDEGEYSPPDASPAAAEAVTKIEGSPPSAPVPSNVANVLASLAQFQQPAGQATKSG